MPMHIISKQALREFWAYHPGSANALAHWHTTLMHARAADFDAEEGVQHRRLGEWIRCFQRRGNKYRIVADIMFRSQTVFIKHVFTHKEYDSWQP